MEKEALFELKVVGFDELAKLTQAIKDNQAAIKDTTKTGAVEAEQRKIQLKDQQKRYRDLQKDVINKNKADEQGVRTLEKMRAELARLNAQTQKMDVGSKAFKDAQAQALKLRAEINGIDQEAGKFQGNVGNYKNSVIDAFQAMGINVRQYTGQVEGIATAFQTTTKSTEKATFSVKLFGKALIATGIGAIVVAVGALAAAFFSTEQGSQALQSVLIPLRTVMQRLWGLVQELSIVLVDAFSNPKQAVKDLWEAIKTNLLNRLNGMIDMFKGAGRAIKAALKLDFDGVTEASKDFGNAWLQTITGVEDAAAKAAAALKIVVDQVKDSTKEGKRLTAIRVELRKLAVEEAQNVSRLRREQEEQLAILQNINRTDEERMKAGEDYMALSMQLFEFERRRAVLELEQAELTAKQNDTDLEAQVELAQARERLEEITARQLATERRARRQINAIQKKTADERIKQSKEAAELEAKIYQDGIKAIEEISKKWDEIMAKRTNPKQVLFPLFDEEEIEDIPDFIATVSELSMEELRLAKETTEGIKVGYNERLSALKELLKQGLITEQQFALRKKQLNADLADATIASLQGVAKEGSAISRGLFVFEKVLAVRKAFMAIIQGTAETAKVGFPQNIPLLIGFAAQVAGLIGALKGVAAPEPPKFARGVIGLQGAGTETSDSIDAKLSRGESVLTARATKVFAPTLAAMERAVGNEPNVNIGTRRFAGGFIPQPAAALTPDYDPIIRQTLSAVGRIPVVVSEGDITEVQQNVRQIKVAGDW
jgi:DNA repair exonuclease SbcCD ATPase subunit